MHITLNCLLILIPGFLLSQNVIPMDKTESRLELSMSEVNADSRDGVYRYYEKGSSQPYTGVLYALYPNGNTLSWQEYENGVGQGKWINYYENGNLKEVGRYEQNRVEGPIRKYYENGQLKAVGQYRDWRIMVGQWKYYDVNGAFDKFVDYGEKGSTEEVKAYYDRGEISFGRYKDILSKNGFKL